MTHVTIREVALRDGLQIEAPIPLSAKLDLLAAIAATGVREVEAAERSRARSQLCAPRMGTGTGRGAGMGAVVNAALSAPSCGG